MYTVDYFIRKFEAIPEEKWCTGNDGIRGLPEKCALGFCGVVNAYYPGTEESQSLAVLLGSNKKTICGWWEINVVWRVNDAPSEEFPQPTPKQRVLAALYGIKKMQQPPEPIYQDITASLAILPEEKPEVDVVPLPLPTNY